jgi:hypothetical protein
MKHVLGYLIFSFVILCGSTAAAQSVEVDPTCAAGSSKNADEIKGLVASLESFDGSHLDVNYADAYSLLAHLNNVVVSNADIAAFRCQDNLQVAQKLIDIAQQGDRTLRISASRLLANIVDNTTLCTVLDKLAGPGLNDDTRYNFWQVVLVVAGYARVENQDWIRSTIAAQKVMLTDSTGYDKTLGKISQIEQSLAQNKRTEKLVPQFQASYQQCLKLPNIAKFTAPDGAPPKP